MTAPTAAKPLEGKPTVAKRPRRRPGAAMTMALPPSPPDCELRHSGRAHSRAAWLDNLERNLPAVEAISGGERARLWRLYLAGAALAFEEGRMGVDQILAARRG